MISRLPSSEQLEKLPIRAIVAYAGRTVSRLSATLRGVVPDEFLDEALRLIDAVSTTHRVTEVNEASVVRAVQRVAEAYAAAPPNAKSFEKFRIVFSLTHAALAAVSAVQAGASPEGASQQIKRVSCEAHRAVRVIEVLESEEFSGEVDAAREDYGILLSTCGTCDYPTLGCPVRCFDEPK